MPQARSAATDVTCLGPLQGCNALLLKQGTTRRAVRARRHAAKSPARAADGAGARVTPLGRRGFNTPGGRVGGYLGRAGGGAGLRHHLHRLLEVLVPKHALGYPAQHKGQDEFVNQHTHILGMGTVFSGRTVEASSRRGDCCTRLVRLFANQRRAASHDGHWINHWPSRRLPKWELEHVKDLMQTKTTPYLLAPAPSPSNMDGTATIAVLIQTQIHKVMLGVYTTHWGRVA